MHDKNDTSDPGADDQSTTSPRYRAIAQDGALLVFDRDAPSAWLQTEDTVVLSTVR